MARSRQHFLTTIITTAVLLVAAGSFMVVGASPVQRPALQATAQATGIATDAPPPDAIAATATPTLTPSKPPFTVYLSFDDGPRAGTTDKILDVLKQYGVKATFFIQGSNVAKAQAIVKREFEEGHRIGSHLWNHAAEVMAQNAPKLAVLMARYKDWQDVMKAALGDDEWAQYEQQSPKVLRWPGGAVRAFPLADTITYNWNVSAGDDVPLKITPQLIARNVLLAWPNHRRFGVYAWGDGVVILFHDTHPLDAEALPYIIEQLQAHGATFGTLPRPGDEPGTMPIVLGNVPPCARTPDDCAKENSAYQPMKY